MVRETNQDVCQELVLTYFIDGLIRISDSPAGSFTFPSNDNSVSKQKHLWASSLYFKRSLCFPDNLF